MAIGFRSASSVHNLGLSATAVCTPPSGIVDNDILIAIVYVNTPSQTITPPAGWTTVDHQESFGGGHMGIYWKRASSESGNYTFTFSSAQRNSCAIAAYTGAVTSGSPVDVFASVLPPATTTTFTVPSVTTTYSVNELLVYFGAVDGSGAESWTVTGMTERLDAGPPVLVIADETLAAIGATGSRTGTTTTAQFGVSFLVALKPAQVSVSPGIGALALAGFASVLSQVINIKPGFGVLSVTGYAPVISTSAAIQPGTGQLVATGFAPTIGSSQTIASGRGQLVVTGFAPTISSSQGVQPGLGQLVVTGFAPTISSSQSIQPGRGQLLVTGFAPIITVVSSGTIIVPGVGHLQCVGYAPILSMRATEPPHHFFSPDDYPPALKPMYDRVAAFLDGTRDIGRRLD